MHDHNLNDLIIDSIEPKNSKTKSLLTIIALFIVVLIVAIILTKILLKAPDNDVLAFEQNETEMIAPELKLQETPKSQETKKEPSLSSIIENEPKAPVVETKKPVTTKEQTVEIQEEETLPEIKVPAAESKQPTTIEEEPEETIKGSTQVEEPIEIAEQSKPKPVIRAVQKTSVPKPIKEPVVANPETVSSVRYYIQIGSFKKLPSKRFLSVIINNGFNYTITNPTADGTKKLLIGPYNDRASANRTLNQVRDRINKSAFVVKR